MSRSDAKHKMIP